MVRSLLVAVLAVSALASCGDSSDAPRVAASAPAGKVVELAGKVDATRSGKTRPLAMGAEVFADDQIATAADATVTIELFHNNARWAVTSNKQARVDTSLAWGLDKQQATAATEHNSAAAGREAERRAAETRATSESARQQQEEKLEREQAMKDEPSAAPAAPAPAQTTGAAPGTAPETVKSPPPPPKAKRDAAPRANSTGIVGGVGTKGRASGAGAGPKLEVAASSQLSTLVGSKRAELKACLEADATLPITIFVRVDKGKVVVTGKPSAKARTCMQKVIEKLEIASVTEVTKIELR